MPAATEARSARPWTVCRPLKHSAAVAVSAEDVHPLLPGQEGLFVADAPEDVGPLVEASVRGPHNGAVLAAADQDLKEERGLGGVQGQEADLGDDQQAKPYLREQGRLREAASRASASEASRAPPW